MNNVDTNDMTKPRELQTLTLYIYMDLAIDSVVPISDQGSAVGDFAAHLLTLLGYVPPPRMARTCLDIPLIICAESPSCENRCLYYRGCGQYIFAPHSGGQTERRNGEPRRPRAQLIAEAIAAFETNNYRRTRILNQNFIVHKVITRNYVGWDLAHFLRGSHYRRTHQKC